MYRSLLFRWLPIRRIPKECVAQVLEVRKCSAVELQTRHWSLSVVCSKKRRSVEEKAAESHGRRVIRYSPKASSEVVGIWRDMTVQDIADVLGKDVDHVLRALEFADKTEAEYSAQSVVRSAQVVRDVVKICGHRFRAVPRPDQQEHEEENKDAVCAPPAPAAALRPRPPVVCVMGHVDHGKTTLLDALRNTAVVDTEFGGITQHIGAFEVRLSSGDTVTFLDTPGHAAFCAMRARGARATDLVVLVVAADDGAREQTLESVRMAREAGVPILVAINKIDKPAANIERAIQSLSAHGVVCESLGGDTQAVAVSALKRQGLDALVEALWLQARLRDLRADPDSLVEGVVLEAQLDAKDGRQATVLVQRGTLRCGAVLVAGEGWAKVRSLRASDGRALSAAAPAAAARVSGWRDLPAAGDTVIQVHSEKRAGEVMRWRRAQRMKDKQAADEEAISARAADHRAEYRAALARRRALGRMRVRPDGPRQKMIQEDHFPTLRIIVKGDVDGSVEAILGLLDTYEEHHVVRLDIVHFAVGAVTPGDLEIAEAFNAVIYAFNVSVPEAVLAEARQRRLAVREHNVIYRLVNDVREQINERIPPTQEEEILGEANVLQQFLVSEGKRKVAVAGCRCVRGALARNAQYRLVREQQVVFEGKLSSMKHLKDEVQSIKRDMECGLRFTEHVEARPGDTVLCFRRVDRSHTTAWDPGC